MATTYGRSQPYNQLGAYIQRTPLSTDQRRPNIPFYAPGSHLIPQPDAGSLGLITYLTEPFTGTQGATVVGANWLNRFSTTAATATFNSNRLRLDNGTLTGFNGQYRLSWNHAAIDDTEVSGIINIPTGTNDVFAKIWIREQNLNSDGGDGYSLVITNGATIQEEKIVAYGGAGTIQPLGTAKSMTLTRGSDYGFRYQVIGNVHKWRVWLASGGEPGTWDSTVTDSSSPWTSGLVTLESAKSNLAHGIVEFDDIVITNGGTASGGALTGDASITATAGLSAAGLVGKAGNTSLTVTAGLSADGTVATAGGTTPPTFVSNTASAWNNATTPKTVAITTSAGDLVIVHGVTEDSANVLSTPTTTGITFTLVRSSNVASNCSVYEWQGTDATGGSRTIQSTRTAGGGSWGMEAQIWRNHSGVGASNVGTGSGLPSLGLTTTGAHSGISAVIGDWSAKVAADTWTAIGSSSAVEDSANFMSGLYTERAAHWLDSGAAGAKTIAQSAPAAQTWTLASLEILGVASTGAVTGDASLTVTAGLSAAGTIQTFGDVSLTVTAGLSAIGAIGRFGDATLTITAGLSAAGTVQRFGTATLTTTAGLSATGTIQTFGTVTLTITAGLTSAGVTGRLGTATLTAQAGLSALGIVGVTGNATLGITAGLTAAGTLAVGSVTGDAALTITAGLSAAGTVQTFGTATLTITAGLASAGATGRVSGAAQTSQAGLSATGAIGAVGTATLTITAGLSAAGVVGKIGAATLTITAGLSAGTSQIGDASLTTTAGLSATGLLGTVGTAQLVYTAGLSATGRVARFGTDSLISTAGIIAAGSIGKFTGASLAAIAGIAAAGIVAGPVTYGIGTADVSSTTRGTSDVISRGGGADAFAVQAGHADMESAAHGTADARRIQ